MSHTVQVIIKYWFMIEAIAAHTTWSWKLRIRDSLSPKLFSSENEKNTYSSFTLPSNIYHIRRGNWWWCLYSEKVISKPTPPRSNSKDWSNRTMPTTHSTHSLSLTPSRQSQSHSLILESNWITNPAKQSEHWMIPRRPQSVLSLVILMVTVVTHNKQAVANMKIKINK